MGSDLRVVWLFGLARSGTSVAVYGAAAPWGLPVADEVMGPWDRTDEPYGYPPDQARLVELFKAQNHTLTEPVVALTNRVFAQIADAKPARQSLDPPVLISKWPHLRPSPTDFRNAFPGQPGAYLIRNPLHRLNSLHKRGWTGSFGPKQDLLRYAQYARWWLNQPGRLSFDQFRANPTAFYTSLYKIWQLDCSPTDVATAVAYAHQNYHASSLQTTAVPAGGILSESTFALPQEAFDLYLGDPFIVDFMTEMGWSIDPADYGGMHREAAVPADR